MPDINTRAILLRRIHYGDYDLIVTLFTFDVGKLTVIAKSAKKSKKRFPGILELFNHLAVVYSQSQRQNMSLLKEAVLHDAYINIRADIHKTGYANYWVELIDFWLQEGNAQKALYDLLQEVLSALDKNKIANQTLNIYFQMKFLNLAGIKPNLLTCCKCQKQSDCMLPGKLLVSLKDGGIVCCECNSADSSSKRFALSKGTLKQLIWMSERDLSTAKRVRFSAHGLREAINFLDSFVPYHVGKFPKSLTFLKSLHKKEIIC
jgi:DNA repair protein RecO (recombination protein O)